MELQRLLFERRISHAVILNVENCAAANDLGYNRRYRYRHCSPRISHRQRGVGAVQETAVGIVVAAVSTYVSGMGG